MSEPSIVTKWRSWSPQLLSVLRIVAAFLFIQFGSAKWFAFPAAIMPGGGTAPLGFWPLLNQGTPAVFFCFTFLYLSSAGPGPWSLDVKRGE